jgi:hypothetical protein
MDIDLRLGKARSLAASSQMSGKERLPAPKHPVSRKLRDDTTIQVVVFAG